MAHGPHSVTDAGRPAARLLVLPANRPGLSPADQGGDERLCPGAWLYPPERQRQPGEPEPFSGRPGGGLLLSEPQAEIYGNTLARLHGQYDERDDIFFLAFNPDTSAAGRSRMLAFAQQYQLADPEQCFFLSGTEDELQSLAAACKLPFEEHQMSLTDNALLFFADSLIVRGYYDMRRPDELKRLIRHVTYNIPLKKEKELIFQREKEK